MGDSEAGGRWELVRTVGAAGQARALVDRHRADLGEDAWGRARLLVSELATNAVRHGEGRIELVLSPTDDGLRVLVRDQGSGRPLRRTPGADGGFGLQLLADVADRWGQTSAPTSVWFEVDR